METYPIMLRLGTNFSMFIIEPLVWQQLIITNLESMSVKEPFVVTRQSWIPSTTRLQHSPLRIILVFCNTTVKELREACQSQEHPKL